MYTLHYGLASVQWSVMYLGTIWEEITTEILIVYAEGGLAVILRQ